MIQITNHGPLITATDYWQSDLERAGKLFATVNAGAIRLMLPRVHREIINDLRTAKHCVLSRGPWPDEGLFDAVEILFDDGTDDPFAIHLSPESFALLPAEPPRKQEWVLSVWDVKRGRPHKALERRCYWRRVEKLPCLLPWGKVDGLPSEN